MEIQKERDPETSLIKIRDLGMERVDRLKYPQVSVVMPVRNEERFIDQCLSSVFSLDAEGMEVLVVDGMSTDGTRQILNGWAKRRPNLRVLDNPKRIVPTALNIGIKEAKGNCIIRMDAHTVYARDYVRQCVLAWKQSGADYVGGPWVARGKGYISRAIAAAFHSPFGTGGAKGHDSAYSGPADAPHLGCWPKETVHKFGMFDEELIRNQDDEFCLRILQEGGKLWQSAKIKSWYHPRDSLTALLRQQIGYGYWKVRVIQKHRAVASIRHLIPATMVVLGLILAAASFVWSLALATLAFLGSVYVGMSLVASFVAARREWRLLPVLPLVFGVYHFGYGGGFLCGLWMFVVWIKIRDRMRALSGIVPAVLSATS
jgi:succinoglycan biosynthesis protein ExoA